MSLSHVFSSAVVGLDAVPIEVEVDLTDSLPSFTIVGLPDKAVEESKDRVRAAIKNSDARFPTGKIVVNLAPADLPKMGPAYDLPIAVGILLASGQVDFDPANTLFLGELSLNGNLRHTNGILPAIINATNYNFKKVYLPKINAQEAALAGEMEIIPAPSLNDLILHLKSERLIPPHHPKKVTDIKRVSENPNNFCYVAGQEHAKRALEIAAAGAHNVLMFGPPGSGKTLLSRSFPTILPDLADQENLEVMKIYSVAGLLSGKVTPTRERPFRSPHHTASDIALVGGGKWPRPGEISLAHRGVLFLDEFPEFPRSVLEVLRQPLEDGEITVSRATGSITFPAKFIMIAAANPCPCGFLGDNVKDCVCAPSQISRYKKRISGPILDRIDIHLEVPRVKHEKLTQEKLNEASLDIKKRVEAARTKQQERFSGTLLVTNSEMGTREIKQFCQLDSESKNLLSQAASQLQLSARAFHRTIKLARTIADLDDSSDIKTSHIAEALQYRPKE